MSMEAIYDLNERKGCATAVIRVSDKEFRISRVVTGVRVIYSNMLTEMGGILKDVGSIDPKAASEDELKEALSKADAFKERRLSAMDRCMELLLTRNGYGYDRSWWEDYTDEYDMRSFIEVCLSKDAKGSKKKSAGEGPLTTTGSAPSLAGTGTT